MTSKQTQSLKIPKIFLHSSKLIAYFSPKLATLFAAKLYASPIKHKIPKRELEIDSKSRQKLIEINKINKKVMLYQYGESDKKILLVLGCLEEERNYSKLPMNYWKQFIPQSVLMHLPTGNRQEKLLFWQI